MYKVAASAILLGCLLGCQGSQPSYNLLAPYGSCRVPPPPTGNHSSAAGYYSPATPPTVTVPATRSNATLGAPSAQAGQNAAFQTASGGNWKSANPVAVTDGTAPNDAASVQQASHSEPIQDEEDDNTTASPLGTLQLNGMRVNDATNLPVPGEPARFVPPAGMVPINQAAAQPAPGAGGRTVTSSAKSSDNATPGSLQPAASGSTLNWQSR